MHKVEHAPARNIGLLTAVLEANASMHHVIIPDLNAAMVTPRHTGMTHCKVMTAHIAYTSDSQYRKAGGVPLPLGVCCCHGRALTADQSWCKLQTPAGTGCSLWRPQLVTAGPPQSTVRKTRVIRAANGKV